MRKFTLFIASLFLALGAMAQTNSYTCIADFEAARTNSKVYALKTTRSPLYFNVDKNELAGYWTSSGQSLQGNMANPEKKEQQFAFLRTEATPEGKYYMYSVAGECFINVLGAKSEEPVSVAYFVDKTDKDDANHHGLKLYLGTTGDNVVNVTYWHNNTAGGVRYNTNTEADAGNVYELIAYDYDVDLKSAVEAIEEYESTLYPYNGKIYALDSYVDYLYAKTDGLMNVYTDGSYNGVADTRALWKFEYRNGAYRIKNVHTGLYIGATRHDSSVQMSETPGSYEIVTSTAGETAEVGKYYIKVQGVNACLHSTSQTAKGWQGGGLGNQYVFTEVTNFVHTLAVGETGYATLCLGFDAEIPEISGDENGVFIVTTSAVAGNVHLTKVTGVLPANTAVIVKANPNSDVEFAYSTGDTADVSGNLLLGTLYNKNIAAEAYVLNDGANGIGFYGAILNKDGNTAFLNNANKAYLPATAGANLTASFYGFEWEGTTGIDEITDNRVQSTVIYDLTGRRVEEITAPGIYIVNGKKVLVK